MAFVYKNGEYIEISDEDNKKRVEEILSDALGSGNLTLSEIITDKLTELSIACESTIFDGVDVELSTGTSRFTLDQKDQGNINRMFNAVLLGATEYIYHPDDEGDTGCRTYSASDIASIYLAMEQVVTGQTTYYNQLKQYVMDMIDKDAVQAVQYGQPLTGWYLERYNELMAVAKAQQEQVLSKVVTLNAGG